MSDAHDPRADDGFDAGADQYDEDSVAPLSAAEEGLVQDLLAGLSDPEVPADVHDRIAAAIEAEQLTSAGAPAATVLPTATATGRRGSRDDGSGRPAPRRRSAWLLQSAAVLVIVALLGAVVVGALRDDDQPAATTAGGAASSTSSTPGPITVSGRTYGSDTLGRQVRGLLLSPVLTTSAGAPTVVADAGELSAADDAAEAPTGGSAGAGSGGGTTSQNLASTSGGTSASGPQRSSAAQPRRERARKERAERRRGIAAAGALVNDPARRQACINQLAETPGTQPLTIDVGVFEGRPAAVIVLPNASSPTIVDVWVVGPTCSDADDPFPFRYERVARP